MSGVSWLFCHVNEQSHGLGGRTGWVHAPVLTARGHARTVKSELLGIRRVREVGDPVGSVAANIQNGSAARRAVAATRRRKEYDSDLLEGLELAGRERDGGVSCIRFVDAVLRGGGHGCRPGEDVGYEEEAVDVGASFRIDSSLEPPGVRHSADRAGAAAEQKRHQFDVARRVPAAVPVHCESACGEEGCSAVTFVCLCDGSRSGTAPHEVGDMGAIPVTAGRRG